MTIDTGDSFAFGMLAHFEGFRGEPNLRRSLTIELRNGGSIDLEGLWVERLQNVPGCLMIRGTSSTSPKAVVIREEDLLMARFDLDPEGGFGF